MTIENDDIESVIGPLRSEYIGSRRFMEVANMPDRVFASSYDSPVRDWIGDNVDMNDYSERLKNDGAVPRRSPEKIAAMTPVAFLAFPESIPVLAPGHRWSLIDHRVAGSCAGQRRFCGLRLIMRADISELSVMIHRRFYGTGLGCGRIPLDTLGVYSCMLRSMRLDCNTAYPYLAEGFYPIDFTDDALKMIDRFAPDFDDLIVHRGDIKLARESAIIAIVAPNSD